VSWYRGILVPTNLLSALFGDFVGAHDHVTNTTKARFDRTKHRPDLLTRLETLPKNAMVVRSLFRHPQLSWMVSQRSPAPLSPLSRTNGPMGMSQLPRIAVGTVQPDADLQVMLWALISTLERSGLHIQAFSSQSCFQSRDGSFSITGEGRRHLDSWLMQPEVCAQLFYNATRYADVGLVEGQYDDPACHRSSGGSLNTLCTWLDLPRLVVVDTGSLDPCRPPVLPAGIEGILLDNVADVDHLCRVQAATEALYGVPVLGWLGRIAPLRSLVANLPAHGNPTAELCEALGDALRPGLRLDKLLQIACQRTFALVGDDPFRLQGFAQPLNIAVAYDEAFRCYFPDTLDVLESQGASVSVFSPLRGERLPNNTDVVYFGCGQPEDYVNELAANFCMKESLWNHVVSGGRVYAESAGLAYLCREIVMPCGHHWPMVGLLPALARRNPAPAPDRPVEVTLARGSWLFAANETVRGYLSSKWIIHPDGCLRGLVSEAEHSHDLVGDYQIVGSRIHLNFAARRSYVRKFFVPGRNRLNAVS
jgi:cobyrinic acid a,c-diamide synthase